MKQFVGYLIKKAVGKGKVSPTIKSVKPNLKKSVKDTKAEGYTKNIRALDKAQDKLKTGKQMMQEGQKERKKLVDTGRAFEFKNVKGYHAMGPGDKKKYGKSMKVAGPQKKFKTGKELEREKKMGGGMMGRRFGMKRGTPFKKKTNVEKIKETFSPKGKNLKPVDPKKQKGLSKLPREVRNKMGYMKSGGRAGYKFGSTRPRPDSLLDPKHPINKRKKLEKVEAKEDMK